jgi:hypothetical protein
VVSGNLLSGNRGGILLSDEAGPSAHNVVQDNVVSGNLYGSGITLAGRNPLAYVSGTLQRTAGGVFDNTVAANVVTGNGLRGGGGAGILLASAAPGGAVYDNVISVNSLEGNGHPGVTLQSRAARQYFDGNQILYNVITADGLLGDPAAGLGHTAGIEVFSAATPPQDLEIAGNVIGPVHDGVWAKNVPPAAVGANVFVQPVATDVASA